MCRLCEIYHNKTDTEFENQFFFVIFDQFPVSPGHFIVIPKRHIVSIFDLEQDEWNLLKNTIRDFVEKLPEIDLANRYSKYVQYPINDTSKRFCKNILINPYLKKIPDGYNIGVNEGRAAGRTVDHLHIHVIPRFDGDVPDPVGGIRNIFPEMGNYKKI